MAVAAAVTLLLFFASCMGASVFCTGAPAAGFEDVPTVPFDEGFTPLFGESNLGLSGDGTVRVTLDRHTGSGFISKHYFHHGLFSADVRLPAGHTAGVVVAFYLSNGDVFDDTHDELDFEFLGNRAGHRWRMQTNVYGNGSTARGREERYLMPFDPSAAKHRFSVLWSSDAVVFFVDGTPVREVQRRAGAGMGGDYPSKPMAVYVTIWDGSTWATENGKYTVDYRHGPFTAEFSGLVLRGCPADATGDIRQLHRATSVHRCAARERELTTAEYAVMTARKRAAMRRWRWKQTLYTVCYDTDRYPAALPECDVNAVERQMFERWGESKVAFRSRQRRVETPLAPPLVSMNMMQAD
ncbi:probable xyloglucan endotransglucosylase/hydrolase protein 30 [Lolium perenne]|jgi:xyloglucan:xyloglucosyl transferase|uniref:probable xyloglucan endotransglucosylase/hydrolase protein 30 n=1 Tax=Lolium perenne TaxID=4522 RepID=UPI0021EA0FCA|nr:probable xyloglucan endotransglucosylase/hydrolase protein 30 [Lolium perenne]